MMLLPLAGFAVLVLIVVKAIRTGVTHGSGETQVTESGVGSSPAITRKNPFHLLDCDSANQGGTYSRAFDEAFEKASGATGIPFALIKAHAVRESKLIPSAYRFDNDAVGGSYGLMQIEWLEGSNRFAKYGYPDTVLKGGDDLYQPDINAHLGAQIIKSNLEWLKGNLRDAINAYNTGKSEDKRPAPHHYVDDVLSIYSELCGEDILT